MMKLRKWQKLIMPLVRLISFCSTAKIDWFIAVNSMNIDKEIDARGLNCPLPILKAKKALAEIQSGQVLKVVCTDAGSLRDFQAFARQTGNELLEQQTVGADYIHVLRRR